MADVGFSPAATMAIYAALTYDIVAATNSSPQTTEINASVRAETLMKWVKLGLAQAAVFGILGVIFEASSKRPIWPAALGSGLAGVLLYIQYVHARNVGLAKSGPSTERYQ